MYKFGNGGWVIIQTQLSGANFVIVDTESLESIGAAAQRNINP